MQKLPSNWAIDWRRFYEVVTPQPAGVTLNHARSLDPCIVPALHTLPGEAAATWSCPSATSPAASASACRPARTSPTPWASSP